MLDKRRRVSKRWWERMGEEGVQPAGLRVVPVHCRSGVLD